MTSPAGERVLPRLHLLLLHLAGWVPDDVLVRLRSRLAEGRVSEVARSALTAVLDERIPVRPDDARFLIRVLPGVPERVLLAGAVPAVDGMLPGHDFTPVPPAGGPEPAGLDRTALAALGEVDHPLGLWRTWRLAGDPVPVHLLQTGADAASLPGAADWLAGALAGAGLADPLVEAWRPGVELPAYQRLARDRAVLLWAAEPAGPVSVARVFDAEDPVTGGRFDADHPLLSEGDELARVLDYLDRGRVLATAAAAEPDVFDPGAGAVVPATHRTDGRWIWTDATAHYLRTYALSPDPGLLAHLRERGHVYTAPSDVAAHRALTTLDALPTGRGTRHDR